MPAELTVCNVRQLIDDTLEKFSDPLSVHHQAAMFALATMVPALRILEVETVESQKIARHFD